MVKLHPYGKYINESVPPFIYIIPLNNGYKHVKIIIIRFVCSKLMLSVYLPWCFLVVYRLISGPVVFLILKLFDFKL